jgi:site-specific DNA-cytosine methylase
MNFMPVFSKGTLPSEALPESLKVAAEIFDQWKISGVRGLVKVQSFAFTLVEELVEKVCWKVLTRDERVGEEKSVIVVFDSSWIEWFDPRVGLCLTVLDARLCGVLDDCPVFMVGREGFSFLARRWNGEDLRCLELFAGIGGWSAALPFFDEQCGLVSIELDPQRALALGRMRGCPVVPIDLLLPDMLALDIILLGDVRDRRWLKITLSWPFQFLLQSPPCTSFSGGGSRLGIYIEAGQLLLHGLGIAAVIQAEVSCGENVKGLIRHGHWPIIGLFAHMLGLRHLLVKVLELSHIVPMRRPRCFFLFSREKFDFPINEATELLVPKELWQLSDIYVQEITEEQKKVLSDWELLPCSLKRVCQRLPEQVLEARVQDTLPLPVLMSSYMHQHLLPWDTLVSRGLFAWLVRFGRKTRYLHPCEAARLLGFGPGFHFSTDVDNDLTALGSRTR